MNAVVKAALRRHNPAYVITPTTCTVPLVEELALSFLAAVDVFRIRLGQFSQDSSVQSGGAATFGVDRDTPFQKTLKLLEYYQAEYEKECQRTGLDTFAQSNQPVVSTVTSQDSQYSAQMAIEDSALPPQIALVAVNSAVSNDGTLIIRWAQSYFSNFDGFMLYHIQGADEIFQHWLPSQPKINPIAERVASFYDHDSRSAKVTDLVFASTTVNRFLIVCMSKSGKYNYSNELVVTQP